MTIDIESICKDARIVLDENEIQEPLLGGTTGIYDGVIDNDAMQTDDILHSLVLDAIDRVHLLAPVDILSDAMTQCEVEWRQYELTERASIPNDILRVCYVRKSNWRKGIKTFVDEGSALYSTMFSRFMAVRPTADHPMVGLSHDDNGRLEIVCAPVAGDEDSSSVLVIDKAKEGGVMASRCYRAAVYMLASLYLTSVRESDMAVRMASEVSELLGIEQNKTA